MRGRLGKLSKDGFLMGSAKGSGNKELTLAFTDVQSVKEIKKGNPRKTAIQVVVAVMAVGGVLLLIAVIACSQK